MIDFFKHMWFFCAFIGPIFVLMAANLIVAELQDQFEREERLRRRR